MDPHLASSAISSVLGKRPEHLVRNTDGSAGLCVVFEATLPGGAQVVLKAGETEDDVVVEAWACERAAEAGVPAPRVLAVDASLSVFPQPFFVMERIAGEPIEDFRDARLWREAGRLLRALHSIRLDGYGWLSRGEGNPAGCHSTWRDALERDWLADLDLLDERGVVDAAAFRAALDRHAGPLTYDSPACFVHLDCGPGHLWTDGERITGLIDFADVAAADPAFEFARLAREMKDFDGSPLAEGYFGSAAIPEDFAVRTTVYRAALWASYAGWRIRHGVTEVAMHARFVAEALGRL